jgi:hypothetical protein
VGVTVRRPSVMPQPSGCTRRPVVAVPSVPIRVPVLRLAASAVVGDARRPLFDAAPVVVGETRRPVVAVRLAVPAVGDARRLFN